MKTYGKLKSTKLKWMNQERNNAIYEDYIGFLQAGNDVGDIYVELARKYGRSYRTIQNIITAERKAAGRTYEDDQAIAMTAREKGNK